MLALLLRWKISVLIREVRWMWWPIIKVELCIRQLTQWNVHWNISLFQITQTTSPSLYQIILNILAADFSHLTQENFKNIIICLCRNNSNISNVTVTRQKIKISSIECLSHTTTISFTNSSTAHASCVIIQKVLAELNLLTRSDAFGHSNNKLPYTARIFFRFEQFREYYFYPYINFRSSNNYYSLFI
jgi:hypothetical protein